MREQTDYNKLIARRGNEYIFCDYIFQDGDFKGATGTVLVPVSKEDYEERTSKEGLIDSLGELWQDAVASGSTEKGKAEWCQYVYDVDGDSALYDFSGSHLWDQLRAIGLSEEDYPVIECVGGGRCFYKGEKGEKGEEFDEVYDLELLAKINEIETPRKAA